MSKTVYIYDKDTGEYLAPYEAQESPLEPNVYLTPTYSTELPPIKVAKGQYAKWSNGWVATSDTRGVWYKPDGSFIEIETLTEAIELSWSRTPPVKVPTLPEQFEAVRVALQNAIDDKAKTFGFSKGDAVIQYAGFPNAFQSLALQFGAWEVSVWTEAEAYRQLVINNLAPIVTPEQAVAMMPEYPT